MDWLQKHNHRHDRISELMSLAKRRLRSDLIPEKLLILRINSLMISRLESWKILKTISHLNSQIELIIKLSLDHWIRKISSLFSIKRSKPSLLHGRLMKKSNYLNLARLKLRKLLIRFMILSLVRDLLRDISMMKLSHKLSIHFWNSRSNIENSPLREFFLITEGTISAKRFLRNPGFFSRHCERSEAIQIKIKLVWLLSGSPRLRLAMTQIFAPC